MVWCVTTAEGSGAIETYIARYGRHHGRIVGETTYDRLIRQTQIQSAAYIFCDFERAGPACRSVMVMLWDALASLGPKVRLFNDPRLQLDRYHLLKALHAKGLNAFDVHWAVPIPPSMRFPVFLRLENDHTGPKTDLLHTRAEVEQEVDRLLALGADPKKLLAVEYCDVRDPAEGTFQKYGAFRIGNRIIGQHRMTGTHWTTKADTMIRTQAMKDRSNAYFLENPHESALMPIFELAGIDYGRIDYGLLDGRIQTWEINDCPIFTRNSGEPWSTVPKDATYAAAFAAMSEGLDPRERLPFCFSSVGTWGRLAGSEA